MIYLCLIIVAVVMDQILKYIVVNDLGMMNSVPVIENFFYIHCIPNDGIALGMLAGKQTVVIAITSVLMAALGIFFFLFRKKFHPFLLCAVAFIVGGGIGNIIDRIRLGYVVDFLNSASGRIFSILPMCSWWRDAPWSSSMFCLRADSGA